MNCTGGDPAFDFSAAYFSIPRESGPTYDGNVFGSNGLSWLATYFSFASHSTSLSRELIAGITTFTTMSYIVVVNPAILASAGIPEGSSFVATALVAAIGCFLMGLYA